MAIATVDESVDFNVTRPEPFEVPTNVVVDVDTPIAKSTEYLGTKWKVNNYYNQILAGSDQARNYDPNLPLNEQNYDRIDNFVLSVTQGYSAGGPSVVNGVALIGSDIHPYIGDVFIADLDPNRRGMFRVTDVVLKNNALNKVYEITYTLDTDESVNPQIFHTIDRSVTRVYVYDDNSLLTMSGQILLTEDYASKNKVEDEIKFIMPNYIHDFLNERKMLVSPAGVYDSFAVTMFIRLYTGAETIDVKEISADLTNTIYDLLLEQRGYMTNYLVDLGASPVSSNIYEYEGRLGALRSGAEKTIVSGITTPPLVNVSSELPVAEKYLFTSEFLTDLTTSCLLEELLKLYISDDLISNVQIMDLIESYRELNDEERYFYTPMYLLLYKYYVTKSYSKK